MAANRLSSSTGSTGADTRDARLDEILYTERDYVNDLKLTIDIFLQPMRQRKLLEEQKIYALFCNLETIVGVNTQLLIDLEQRMSTPEKIVGDLFVQLGSFFKVYTFYCTNQPVALQTLEELGKDSKFKSFLDEAHQDPRLKGLFFSSYLIKPIQRICKYPLLLKEVVKATPEDHPDYENLVKATEEINDVVGHVNEGKRVAEAMQKVIEIGSMVDGAKNLLSPSRRYVMEGDLHFVKDKHSDGRERHVFLFSDLILVTSRKGKEKLKYRFEIDLDGASMINLSDTKKITNAFEVTREEGGKDKRWVFMCASPDMKKEWAAAVNTQIKEFKKVAIRKLRSISSARPLGANTPPGSPAPTSKLAASPPAITSVKSAPEISPRNLPPNKSSNIRPAPKRPGRKPAQSAVYSSNPTLAVDNGHVSMPPRQAPLHNVGQTINAVHSPAVPPRSNRPPPSSSAHPPHSTAPPAHPVAHPSHPSNPSSHAPHAAPPSSQPSSGPAHRGRPLPSRGKGKPKSKPKAMPKRPVRSGVGSRVGGKPPPLTSPRNRSRVAVEEQSAANDTQSAALESGDNQDSEGDSPAQQSTSFDGITHPPTRRPHSSQTIPPEGTAPADAQVPAVPQPQTHAPPPVLSRPPPAVPKSQLSKPPPSGKPPPPKPTPSAKPPAPKSKPPPPRPRAPAPKPIVRTPRGMGASAGPGSPTADQMQVRRRSRSLL